MPMDDLTNNKMDSGPGQVFIDGREALGITREQAAESLNLSVRTIKAIEDAAADSLPDIVYVNGYIRSYAKLLGIASQPLIDAWRAQHGTSEDKALPLDPFKDASEVDAVNVKPMKMGRWAFVALSLSAIFVYVIAPTDDAAVPEPQREIASVSSDGELADLALQADVEEKNRADEASVSAGEPLMGDAAANEVLEGDIQGEDNPSIRVVAQQAAIPEEKPEASAEESLPDVVAQTVVQEVNLAAIPEQIAAIEASTQTPTEEVAQIETETDASSAEPKREVAKAFALPRLTEFGDNVIDLTFSADCWFEIRTVNGELLHTGLGRAGQNRRYVGAAPFWIKLGFSPGASLSYNGEPIDLAPYTRQKVARVLLVER